MKKEIFPNSQWYNMPGLNDMLVFLFPPLGFYILYKQKRKLLKPTKEGVN